MTTRTATFRAPALRLPPVLLGGLLVGTFDLVFACTWWKVAHDVPPIRIFQSIGAGLLGDASFEGGVRSAAIGGVAHYFIATCMVLAYALVSTRMPTLLRRPVAWGVPYGLFLYGLMTCIIVPLSAASASSKINVPWMTASVVVHVLIGIACALIARRAVR
jgi:hypothetical protein